MQRTTSPFEICPQPRLGQFAPASPLAAASMDEERTLLATSRRRPRLRRLGAPGNTPYRLAHLLARQVELVCALQPGLPNQTDSLSRLTQSGSVSACQTTRPPLSKSKRTG